MTEERLDAYEVAIEITKIYDYDKVTGDFTNHKHYLTFDRFIVETEDEAIKLADHLSSIYKGKL